MHFLVLVLVVCAFFSTTTTSFLLSVSRSHIPIRSYASHAFEFVVIFRTFSNPSGSVKLQHHLSPKEKQANGSYAWMSSLISLIFPSFFWEKNDKYADPKVDNPVNSCHANSNCAKYCWNVLPYSNTNILNCIWYCIVTFKWQTYANK